MLQFSPVAGPLIRRLLPLRGATICVPLCALLNAHAAVACSCNTSVSIARYFERADAVFLGVLEAQEDDYLPDPALPKFRKLVFSVSRSWKGVTGSQVGAITIPGGSFAGCGFFGQVGDEYLMFGEINEDENAIEVNLCSFFAEDRRLSDRLVELRALGVEEITLIDAIDPVYPPGGHPEEIECEEGEVELEDDVTSDVDVRPQTCGAFSSWTFLVPLLAFRLLFVGRSKRSLA